jgi:hypothetical protein
MISPEDLSLYLMTDKLDAAVQEIVGFYRVYHSIRFMCAMTWYFGSPRALTGSYDGSHQPGICRSYPRRGASSGPARHYAKNRTNPLSLRARGWCSISTAGALGRCGS